MDTIADLYASHPFWAWASLGAALLAVEVVTGSGWLLWAAASAGVTAAAVAFAHVGMTTAVLIFAALTIVSTLLARRYLPPPARAGGGDINDNIGRLIGHRGSATQAFAHGAGRVSIDGKEWAARLDGADALEVGADVEVVGVDGSRLTVRRA